MARAAETTGYAASTCLTCKQRKVKCDRQRPFCQRCIRSRFRCRGYEPENKFRFLNTSVSYPVQTRKQAQRQDKPLIVVSTSNSTKETIESSLGDVVPQRIPLIAYRDLAHLAFSRNDLGQSRGSRPDRTPVAKHMGFLDITSHTNNGHNNSAMRALCAAYFGKRHHCTSSLQHGQALYGNALGSLNERLRDRVLCRSEDTLRDTMLLILYETVAGTTPTAWVQHASGLAQLLKLRGAQTFTSEFSLYILHTCRVLIAAHCIVLRQPCFLSQYDWQQRTACGSPVATVTDLLCCVPDLLADAECLKARIIHSNDIVGEDAAQIHAGIDWDATFLCTKIQGLLGKLFTWRLDFIRDHGSTITLVPREKMTLVPGFASVDSFFTNSFLFSDLSYADASMLYGAIFVRLSQLGVSLDPGFLPTEAFSSVASRLATVDSPSSCPLSFPSATLTMGDVAAEMCRMADFFLLESHRSLGAFALIFPLRTIMGALDPLDHPIVCAHASTLLKWIQRQASFSVAQHVN